MRLPPTWARFSGRDTTSAPPSRDHLPATRSTNVTPATPGSASSRPRSASSEVLIRVPNAARVSGVSVSSAPVDAEGHAEVLLRRKAGVVRRDAFALAAHEHHDRRKHDGERDLRDDDCRPYAAEAHATAAGGSRAKPRPESTGDFSRRHHPRHHRADHRERERGTMAVGDRLKSIQKGSSGVRRPFSRYGLPSASVRAAPPPARPPPHAGEHQRLGEELRHDAPAARAQRAADENLRLPRRGTREEQAAPPCCTPPP